MLVDVVFPCLNEAQALPWVLSRMPEGYRAIVADNGSTDESARIAASFGALVVSVPQRGFGAAVAAGVEAASAEVICICDGDASLDPQQLPLVAGSVLAGTADLVLGSRQPVSRGAWPVHARLANRVLARRMNRVMGRGRVLTDLGPMRAARRADLLALDLIDRRFGYPLEMVLRAAQAGWRITEVGVDYRPREGRSKVTGTVRGTLRAVKDMRAVLAR
ncbi:MAG TPA: glycosyltransferase family 2 protein [Frankiaceae bacterium]|nr:glycosyltransferase family 2 protein [Frankiaceae bacterium]